MKLVCPLVLLLIAPVLAQARAQDAVPAPAASSGAAVLPDAPQTESTGTITGRVLYSDTQPVSGAKVTLQPASGPALQVDTDAAGGFLFLRVPAGPFRLKAESEGLAPASADGTLPAAGGLDVGPMVLEIAALVTRVNAISEEQAAEEQVRQEEHQRIAGVIPNFFVVYDDQALPLSSGQKFRLSARTLFDPSTIAVSAIIAGGEQAANSYPGFGSGMRGYARRFGASYADGATGIMLSSWVLPTVLHQDPRFLYMRSGTLRARVGNVLRQAVEQKGDNGRWQPAWSNTLGGVGSALISTTYYPAQDRSRGTIAAENFGLGVLSQAIANTLQQFVFNHVTTHKDAPPAP